MNTPWLANVTLVGRQFSEKCAHGNNANKTRIYKLAEMDADHVAAWSKGGASTLDNCEMLCVPHNRSKGRDCPLMEDGTRERGH